MFIAVTVPSTISALFTSLIINNLLLSSSMITSPTPLTFKIIDLIVSYQILSFGGVTKEFEM